MTTFTSTILVVPLPIVKLPSSSIFLCMSIGCGSHEHATSFVAAATADSADGLPPIGFDASSSTISITVDDSIGSDDLVGDGVSVASAAAVTASSVTAAAEPSASTGTSTSASISAIGAGGGICGAGILSVTVTDVSDVSGVGLSSN